MLLDHLLTFLTYLVSCMLMFYIGTRIYSLLNRDINVASELVEKDNLAFSFTIVGYYVGVLLAIGAAFYGPSDGLVNDLLDLVIYGFLSFILLALSAKLNDVIILRSFNLRKEIIDDQNAGTGVIQGANYIATGLIIFSAVSGEGGGLYSAVGIWAIAQIVFIVTELIYNAITPYNIHEHIEKDNVAVGVGFAGAMLSVAIIISSAVSGEFTSWTELGEELIIALPISLILLPIIRLLTDKILLPGQKLTDEMINQEKPNVGAAVVEAFAYIGSALLITWCL